jgi:ClpP class serine protease
MRHPHLWTRLYNAPLLIHPEKAAVIEAVFRAWQKNPGESNVNLAAEGEVEPAAAPAIFAGIKMQSRRDKPYSLTESGIALIPVLGTLIQRGDWMDAMSGLTSYGRIQAQVDAALMDPEARAILLEIDSHGGEAYGLFELAAQILAVRDVKPVYTHANERAYSAAYALLAAGEQRFVPLTGSVGSIGTIMMHVDQSKRDAKQGYEYTFVYAGAHKKDFNSHEPLSAATKGLAQAEVDRHYGIFTAYVAQALGISEDAVRATEAGLMTPQEAVDGGFATGIATLAQTVGLLEQELAKSNTYFPNGGRMAARHSSTSKENIMADTKNPAAPAFTAEQQTQVEAALTDAHAAGVQEGKAAGTAEGTQAGAIAERGRILGILACDEAKGRSKLAHHLALETDTAPEAAKKLLAASAAEPAAPANALDTMMRGLKNPAVGTDPDEDLAAAAGKPKLDTRAIYEKRSIAAKPVTH